jgi:hypothetical protein
VTSQTLVFESVEELRMAPNVSGKRQLMGHVSGRGISSMRTTQRSTQPKKEKTLADYIYYVGSIRQAAD